MHRQLLILLSFVPFITSCFTTNRCQCDRVQYIDQAGIRKLEYGSYLANRTTTRPNVTVTDSCQIVVDVSRLDTDNHYLMVFRDGAPPIFAKRLSDSTEKVIVLTDISCVQVGKEHEWQYYEGKVNSISVAVQSNEETCGCDIPRIHVNSVNVTIDPERCDQYSVNCVKDAGLYLSGYSFFRLASSPWNTEIVIEDLTCVSGQWYYNSVPSKPYFLCSDSVPQFHGGCSAFQQVGVDFLGIYTPDPEGRFANYTLRNGTATYNETALTAELNCPEGGSLVIFSLDYEPLIYPSGTKSNIMCDYTPLKTNSYSQKYWFVDGIMLTNPFFGCYANKCPCSFAYLSGHTYRYWISSHPSVNNVSAMVVDSPYSVYQQPINGDCPDYLDCHYMKTLILDTTTVSQFPEAEIVNVSCSATTKNWTIEGKQFDHMYAMCIY